MEFTAKLDQNDTFHEQKRDDPGILHDLDLKDSDDDSYRIYQPKMVTTPLRLYEPPNTPSQQKSPYQYHDPRGNRADSTKTLYDKVFLSISQGNDPKNISIPDHCVSRNIVFYKVVTSNELLKWDSWIRYDDFASLHKRLKILAASLDVTLPPLPQKYPKALVNHKSEEFINTRRMGLEFYLRKLNKNLIMRYSEDFVSFLLPPQQSKFKISDERKDGAGTWGSSEEEPFADAQKNKEGLGTWGSSSEGDGKLSRPLHHMLPLALLMPNDRENSLGPGKAIPLVRLER